MRDAPIAEPLTELELQMVRDFSARLTEDIKRAVLPTTQLLERKLWIATLSAGAGFLIGAITAALAWRLGRDVEARQPGPDPDLVVLAALIIARQGTKEADPIAAAAADYAALIAAGRVSKPQENTA